MEFRRYYTIIFSTLWIILGCSGCYNTHLRLGGLLNKYLFLTVLGGGSPSLGCQHGWVLVGVLSLVCRLASYWILTWQQERKMCVSSKKGTNPTVRAPPSWPNYLPKAPPPNIMLVIGLHRWGRGTNMKSFEKIYFYSTPNQKSSNSAIKT